MMEALAGCEPIELVIARAAWEGALRSLLLDGSGYAVGEIRRQPLDRGCRLIVERLDVVGKAPRGAGRPPLSDWCVLHVVSQASALDAATLIDQAAPSQSQGLAAVALRRGEGAAWDAAWFCDGRATRLAGVRVVGAGMLHLVRPPHGEGAPAVLPAPLSPAEDVAARRWSRTTGALGPRVVAAIRQARVTLIGAGRNGSLAAWQLAALGVGQLRLVDPDVLELENLDAMSGLDAGDVGQPKVRALARRLLEFRPDLAVTCLARSATGGQVLDVLGRLPADLVISAVDSDAARLAAGLLARQTLAPHLDVGTSVRRAEGDALLLSGDARLLLPGQGCVACVGGLAEPDQALYELAAPPRTLRRGRPQDWHVQRAGSLVTLNAMTVAAGVQLWLDLLAGSLGGSFWQRLRWVPGQGIEAEAGPVGADESCPFCQA